MNGRSSCVAPEVVYSGGGAGQALHAYEFLEPANNALALNLCMAFRCRSQIIYLFEIQIVAMFSAVP